MEHYFKLIKTHRWEIFRWSGVLLIGIYFSSIMLNAADGRHWKKVSSESNPFEQFLTAFQSLPSYFEAKHHDSLTEKAIENKSFTMINKGFVYIEIDQESEEQFGKFPWNEQVHSGIIELLEKYSPRFIHYDIAMDSIQGRGEDYKILQQNLIALQDSGTQISFRYWLNQFDNTNEKEINAQYEEETNINFDNMAPIKIEQKFIDYFQERSISDYKFPNKNIITQSSQLAFNHIEKDPDGVARNITLLSRIEDGLYPSSALLILLKRTKRPIGFLKKRDRIFLQIDKRRFELDRLGRVKIRWRLDDNIEIQRITLSQLMNEKSDSMLKSLLQKKTIFIGTSIKEYSPPFQTALDPKNDTLISLNLLDYLDRGEPYAPSSSSVRYSLFFFILFLIGSTLAMVFFSWRTNLIAAGSYFLLIYIFDHFWFFSSGIEFKVITFYFGAGLSFAWNCYVKYYIKYSSLKYIKSEYSHYLAPAVITEVAKNVKKLKLDSDTKNITVMFSEIENFVPIAEKMEAEKIAETLKIYLGDMTDILFESGGTLDKYIADAIVGYWGAPFEKSDHAYLGVKTGIEMVERMYEMNRELKERGLPYLHLRIGMNTGDCTVGNLGCEQVFSYTAIGPHMNLGSKLESLGKYYGTQFTISEYTYNAIPQHLRSEFIFRKLDKVRCVDLKTNIYVYEVLDSKSKLTLDAAALETYEKALQAYFDQDFKKTEDLLMRLTGRYPKDLPSFHLMKKAHEFRKMPPTPDWDGVTLSTRK